MPILALVEPRRICDQISTASACPDFAARLFARQPLAFSLPQDSQLELMLEPCANSSSGASASPHSNLATLRKPRIDPARRRASHNCFMQRLNPTRADRRSTLVALKPFDRLDFLTATKRQKPAKRQRSPRFGRNAPEVCRKTRHFRPLGTALNVTRAKPLNSHPVSAVALMRRLRSRKHIGLVQQQHREAEAKIKHREHEEGVAIAHHHRLAVHDLRQLLHRHQRCVACA
jgi:hypothetical protein